MPPSSLSAANVDLDTLLAPGVHRSPDMQAVWDWLAEQDAGLRNWLDLTPAEGRAQYVAQTRRWNADMPAMAATEALTLAGSPKVKAELIVPKGARPGCIVYLHGGGWAFGDLATHARLMRLLAADTATRVIGVDYRLAPEHPAPAAFEDCLAAWRSVVGNGHDPDFDGPLVVAGDSAGANLALAVTLAEIREGRRRPDAALLFYGAYAGETDSPSYRRFAEGYGLTQAGMRRFWDWYAPQAGAVARDDVRVGPIEAPEADIARLPPLFLNAAGLDPLLCDTLDLARRVEAAGVPHRLLIHEGVHHGFMQMSLRLPEARSAIRQAAAFFDEQAER